MHTLQNIVINLVNALGIQALHIVSHQRSIFIGHIIQQALQIAGNKNIHGRRNRFIEFAALIIGAGIDKISQNLVAIRCAQQTLHGQAHQLSIIASQNIAKIAGGHNKVHLVAKADFAGSDGIHISTKIVHNLRHQAAPVDGVSRREGKAIFRQLIAEHLIAKNFLYTALSIVKIALNAKNLHVFAHLGNHLALLDIAHALAGIENNDLGALHISKALQGSLTGITGGSNQNNHLIGFASFFHGASQQMGQKLQCHILKGGGGTMPQLQHSSIIIHLHQRHRVITKFFLGVGSIHAFAQLILAKISQKLQQYIDCSFSIRLFSHGFNIAHTHARNALGHKQATIIGQTTSNRMG